MMSGLPLTKIGDHQQSVAPAYSRGLPHTLAPLVVADWIFAID